jgi:iron(III) transport system substrate-binding protein
MPLNKQQRAESNWPGDEFGGVHRRFRWWWLLVVGAAALGVALRFATAPTQGKTVVVYCAQDQEYAQPIFSEFEKETGIKVLPVFDNEAAKTVGLANRLVAERKHPVCDVFWGNEEMRTRQLAELNVFRETNGWAEFGYRSRRIVINTTKLALEKAPRSLLEFTNAAWRGKFAVAYPLSGTTATHFQALRQHWGQAAWESWCRGLAQNKPFLVDGNSVVVRIVGTGEAWIGLTDSDDIAAGQREGFPVAALEMNDETLLIPNTAAVIRSAPHPREAEQIFAFLQRRQITDRLVAANALEGVTPTQIAAATLHVNWEPLLRDLKPATSKLSETFLR